MIRTILIVVAVFLLGVTCASAQCPNGVCRPPTVVYAQPCPCGLGGPCVCQPGGCFCRPYPSAYYQARPMPSFPPVVQYAPQFQPRPVIQFQPFQSCPNGRCPTR